MAHSAGGKTTKNHTTTTKLASVIVEFLEKLSCVQKISLGVITNRAGKGRSLGIKIIDEDNCVLVVCTWNSSIQEIRFYSENKQNAKLALARFVRDSGYSLSFGSRRTI